MFKFTRSLIKFGPGSRGIVLPKVWLDYYEQDEPIKKVTVLGDAFLIVALNAKQERKAKAVLELLEEYPKK